MEELLQRNLVVVEIMTRPKKNVSISASDLKDLLSHEYPPTSATNLPSRDFYDGQFGSFHITSWKNRKRSFESLSRSPVRDSYSAMVEI